MTNAKREERDRIGTLPVTEEVGGEGGSYADAAQQRATRTGDAAEAEGTAPVGDVAEAVAPEADEPEDGVHFVADPSKDSPRR